MNGDRDRREHLWRVKLQAYLHDPPEKAFVLFRGGKSHEEGTVAAVLRAVVGAEEIPESVREADRWAAAADRPDRPRRTGERRSAWDRISFPDRPVLVHPLSGQRYEIASLTEVGAQLAETLATDHLQAVLGEEKDLERAFLRLWRLGPEIPDAQGFRSLWRLLPADTRIPDHTIWDHLALASAIAGVAGAGNGAALLAVAIGPVQSFLEQGRSSHDLWAGSHLLSAMAWAALQPIVEELGPDAIVMPNLRGTPLCDAWLREKGVVTLEELEKYEPLWKRGSDAHPLFAATLPNRFLAIVPCDRAREFGERAGRSVRQFALEQARAAWAKIRAVAQVSNGDNGDHAREQIERQLADFPEVYWAAAPWPERPDGEQLERLSGRLSQVGAKESFLDSPQWRLLSREIEVDGGEFWKPNAGVLFPAVHDLVDRALGAVKATRAFDALPQRGYRCSLCGEREWLVPDREAVELPRASGKAVDVWPRIAKQRPAWARGTEHLCALCTLKRVWPTLFVERSKEILKDQTLARYVVSTHTMALVPVLRALTAPDVDTSPIDTALESVGEASVDHWPRVALPRALVESDKAKNVGRRLVAALEHLDDRAAEARGRRDELESIARQRAEIAAACKKALGARIETYYGLLLLDGDGMGGWIAGEKRPLYREIWHPDVVASLEPAFSEAGAMREYLEAQAPLSPGYLGALSRAMSDFALHIVPFVVEELCCGKVLYAGGDDVLAMLPASELVTAIILLRAAWSGQLPSAEKELVWLLRERERASEFRMGSGHVQLRGRLFRMMGDRATCSIGAVVTHHTAPLASVLRELRRAEKRAKDAGRDRFCIVLDKRSGGTTELLGRFSRRSDQSLSEDEVGLQATPAGVLLRLQRLLETDVSRRAAYHCTSWLDTLAGARASDAMLASLVAYQLDRALRERERHGEHNGADAQRFKEIESLAGDLASVAMAECPSDPAAWLADLVRHAEFLARAERTAGVRRAQRVNDQEEAAP